MRQVWAVLRRWVNLAIVDAVRTGAPLPQRWSPGLQAVAALAAVAFVLAAGLAALSPLLRANTDLAVGANLLV
ncbi:MAG: hypothetical protein Q4F67_17140, partial [Propionibacteriaceae bacterium]|nr:hypothetical protein [Propionibacteriaceae bacterium]